MTQRIGPEKSSRFVLLLIGIANAFVITVATGTPVFDNAPPKKFMSLEVPLR
jgi:hypothetical protein